MTVSSSTITYSSYLCILCILQRAWIDLFSPSAVLLYQSKSPPTFTCTGGTCTYWPPHCCDSSPADTVEVPNPVPWNWTPQQEVTSRQVSKVYPVFTSAWHCWHHCSGSSSSQIHKALGSHRSANNNVSCVYKESKWRLLWIIPKSPATHLATEKRSSTEPIRLGIAALYYCHGDFLTNKPDYYVTSKYHWKNWFCQFHLFH